MTAKAIGLRLRFGLNFKGYFSEGLYNELLEDNKSRIEQITGLSGGLSTDVTGHKSKIEKLFGEVSGKATTGNFTEAANQFDVELVPALALAEEAAETFREAKNRFDREYGAIRGKIPPIVDSWGEEIPQDLKDKRAQVQGANQLVAAEENVFNYVKAVSQMESQGLVEKVNQAESAKRTWDEAKLKYEQEYGAINDKIAAVAGTWGEDISQGLKDQRKTVVDLNKLVTDEAAKFAFPQAVDLMTKQDLAGKLSAAESAKTSWGEAKVKYEKDYGDIKDKIAAVLTTWTDKISVDLKNLRTALSGSNKKVTDEAVALDFPKAVQLMGSEKLGDKLTAAENGKKAWDTAKNTYDTTFVPLLGRINVIVLFWPADISADLKLKQDELKNAKLVVLNQGKIFEFVKAAPLITAQDVSGKLTAAENAMVSWNQAKAKYPATKTLAEKRMKELNDHPSDSAIAAERTNFKNKLDTAVDNAEVQFDYALAVSDLDELANVDFPAAKKTATEEEYNDADDAVTDLWDCPALKTHAKKDTVAADLKAELDAIDENLAKAKSEFDADRWGPATKISTLLYFECKRVTDLCTKHAAYLDRRDDDVSLPADEDPIKPDLAELKKKLAEAATKAGQRLYDPAMKLLDEVVAGCATAKQVKTDHTAHANELKIVEPEVNKLPADNDPLVGNESKYVRAKLAAAKEAAGKRDFAAARTLLAEAKSGCEAANKMIEANKVDKTAKEDAVKGGDPAVSLAEVRKLYEQLKTRAGHEGIVEELKEIEKKLAEADTALKD